MPTETLVLLAMIVGAPAVSLDIRADYLEAPLTRDSWDARYFEAAVPRPYEVNLAPAQWIWMPSKRTLSNTFILFRKELDLPSDKPVRARGWVTADSRYRLTVNGTRVQWGPAPFDPRYQSADPFDIAPLLTAGKNVIGVEVLHYGLGDGTWPAGKPGMIFHVEIEFENGTKQTVVSDDTWQALLDRAHAPGQHKRWYLRALQEEFDARLHPVGWDTPDFEPGTEWLAAMPITCAPDKPAACSNYESNDLIDRIQPENGSLRTRQIPLTREIMVPAKGLADSGRVHWRRDPRDWFDMRIPDAFEIIKEPVTEALPDGSGYLLPATLDSEGVYATFEFTEQLVGWPRFAIEAPEGAIVEMMVQESHAEDGPAWLDTHFFAWTRFICREGINHFEPFDYESFRWVQLHVRNASRPVRILKMEARRRLYDWPNPVRVQCADAVLQRLFDATTNTLNNSAIDVVVDGMGRERQQYSGDCGPQLFAIRYGFGDTLLPARFLRTFSEGLTPDGYFLDCWPAFDRLARGMQKQVQAAYWGPILDHGVGFVFDCWNHYLETGDREAVAEAYPRLVRFAAYLESVRGEDGLLPVENLGIPTVWIDHNAYKKTAHKSCAFNLYAAAMFRHALAPLAIAFEQDDRARAFEVLGDSILEATRARYWDSGRGLFMANRPWMEEEKEVRLCDRSLATSILFNQCPDGNMSAALEALASCPSEMGLSYPANAYWRYWALAKGARMDVVLDDFRKRWATMGSVLLNNTLQEDWTARPDSTAEWSHCPVCPLYLLYMDIMGIRATSPGFATCDVRPQLADMGDLEATAHTVRGAFTFKAVRKEPYYDVMLTVPKGCQATLVLPEEIPCELVPAEGASKPRLKRYHLQDGTENRFMAL